MTIQPAAPAPGVLSTITAPQPGAPLPPGVEAMRTWLDLASAAEQLVGPLIGSAFIPQSFRTKGTDQAVERANATGAVLLGLSLGIDPLTALQQIYVVHGRPGMYARMKVALAQAHGHEVWDEEHGPDGVTVCGRRKGWPDDRTVRVTVTIEDAKRAGWTSNDAYRKTPADMLWARAAGRVVDRIASDVLHGIASIEDIEPEPRPVSARVTVDDLPPAPAPAAITAPAPAPAPEPDPEPEPEPAAVVVEQVTPAPDPARLWDQINARFLELGVTGPGKVAARLTVISAIVDRTITRGSELTPDESTLVLDVLAGDAGAATVDKILNPTADQEPAPADQWAEDADSQWAEGGQA